MVKAIAIIMSVVVFSVGLIPTKKNTVQIEEQIVVNTDDKILFEEHGNLYGSDVLSEDSETGNDEIYCIEYNNMIDALSIEALEQNHCLQRSPDMEEDLSSVVYKCDDGNYVAYFFQHPVKYEEDGKIKDIDTSIIKRNGNNLKKH